MMLNIALHLITCIQLSVGVRPPMVRKPIKFDHRNTPKPQLYPIPDDCEDDSVDIYYNGAVINYNLNSRCHEVVLVNMVPSSLFSTVEFSATISKLEEKLDERHREVVFEGTGCFPGGLCERRHGRWSDFQDDTVIEDNATGRFMFRTNDQKYYSIHRPTQMHRISVKSENRDTGAEGQAYNQDSITQSRTHPLISIITPAIRWRVHYVLYIDDKSWKRVQGTDIRLCMYANVITSHRGRLINSNVRFVSTNIDIPDVNNEPSRIGTSTTGDQTGGLHDDDDDDDDDDESSAWHHARPYPLDIADVFNLNDKVQLPVNFKGNTEERLLIDEVTLVTKSKWFHAHIPLHVGIVEGNFRLLVGLRSDQHLPGGPHSNMVVMYNEQIYMDTKIPTILSNTETVLKLRHNPDCSYRCVIDFNMQKSDRFVVECELHNIHPYSIPVRLVVKENIFRMYRGVEVFQGIFYYKRYPNGLMLEGNLSANSKYMWSFDIL